MLLLSAAFRFLASHTMPTNLPVLPSLPLPFPMIPFFKLTSLGKPSLPVVTDVRYWPLTHTYSTTKLYTILFSKSFSD